MDISRSARPTPVAVLPARRFRRRQRAHFVLAVVLPAILTIAGLILLPSEAFDYFAVVLWAVMWTLVGGLGVSVGYHRLFAHRSFSCSPGLRVLLGALGSMAAQGPAIYWVSVHRLHHARSDNPGDPHSPNQSAHGHLNRLQAFLVGHVGWAYRHDVPKTSRYAVDLINDPHATKLNERYPLYVALGVILPGLLGAIHWGAMGFAYGAFWGGIFRISVGHQIIWSINSVCHAFGSRPFDTPDRSTNVRWLSVPSFGESWHNNHHATPTSAKFGRRSQLDLGWIFILVLSAIDRSLTIRTRS
jgi:stearoyl-CoA desaturase (delta-9 desaturase)